MLKIKVDKNLFQVNSLSVFCNDDEVSQPLDQYSKNTKLFIQDNFPYIYETILKTLLVWQDDYNMKFEIYNDKTYHFYPVEFSKPSDIHILMGFFCVILLNACKNNSLYYAVSFYKDCKISIEHGLTAIFHQNRLIDLDATDHISMLQKLKWDEPNSDLWEIDNWKKGKLFKI